MVLYPLKTRSSSRKINHFIPNAAPAEIFVQIYETAASLAERQDQQDQNYYDFEANPTHVYNLTLCFFDHNSTSFVSVEPVKRQTDFCVCKY